MDQAPQRTLNPIVSVVCAVFGFDGQQLNLLLVPQNGSTPDRYRLPGESVYMDEDLDEAAQRVLLHSSGLKRVALTQFKAFGCTDGLVTIGYFSLMRIDRRNGQIPQHSEARWVKVSETERMEIDQKSAFIAAYQHIQTLSKSVPATMFALLPRKFTALQLHSVYQAVMNKTIDVRNFHKMIQSMPHVVALEEREEGVNHRAARYFRYKAKPFVGGSEE